MSDVISPVPSYFCVSLSYLYMGTHLISLSYCNLFLWLLCILCYNCKKCYRQKKRNKNKNKNKTNKQKKQNYPMLAHLREGEIH